MILGQMWTDPWLRLTAGLAFGLIAGSFVATLVIRWPADRSVVRGRSACDGCGRPLAPFELIPVVSFALQRGACRRCGHPIDRRHLYIEILGAVIGAVSVLACPGWEGLVGAAAGWILLGLACLDADHLWLPDRLTFPLLLLGLAASAARPPPALVDALIGAVAGWGVLAGVAAAYRSARGRPGLGGGDPKLFAGIGAWLGWRALPPVLLAACMLGLSLALVMRIRGRDVGRTTELPFGTLLAAAAWPLWVYGILP